MGHEVIRTGKDADAVRQTYRYVSQFIFSVGHGLVQLARSSSCRCLSTAPSTNARYSGSLSNKVNWYSWRLIEPMTRLASDWVQQLGRKEEA